MMGERTGRCLLFWDYDTQWGADRSRSGAPRPGVGALEFVYADRLLELLAEYELPACFAVVGAAALSGRRPYHDPAQIRRIHDAGHEVASHAFRHEWLPGLDPQALRITLACSKDALEQCIGAAVTAFVPPFNQPFDHPGAWSWSRSERREVRGGERTDLPRLCRALEATGYRFCRVSYRSIAQRAAEWLLRRPMDEPSRLETIAGITCVRLNTPGGFGASTVAMVERCAQDGGVAVVYGHPHSLGGNDEQREQLLVPLLDRLRGLQLAGRLRVCRPRDLMAA